jgi:hypothetical protein
MSIKKILFLIIILVPILSNAQAHLGSTEKEIRDLHSDKTFEIGYNNDGEKYISSFMYFGTFIYYFDKDTKLSNYCIQIVDKINYLNGQVEAYNKKYVIISDSEWKAYLEGGNILKIKLTYNEEHNFYIFNYSI